MTEAAPTGVVPATIEVGSGSRIIVASDLHLAWRPTDVSQHVATELATVLEGWVGPGVVVFAGDAFSFVDDTQLDPGRVLDAHPRLAAALDRFAEPDGRQVVFLAGRDDAALVSEPRAGAVLVKRYRATVASAAELRVVTGVGLRTVRVEHGSRWLEAGAPEQGIARNDGARADAERRIRADESCAGLVSGGTGEPELSTLGDGFYANCGTGGVVTGHRRSRLGGAAVPVAERLVSWVELEAGATLHVRLLLSRITLEQLPLLRRITAAPAPDDMPRPTVVATFPGGTDWPAASFAEELRRRRTRRVAGAGLALAGLFNLVSAITPPVRNRFEVLLDVVPVAVPRTASAIVAALGMALLLLARGVRRGQRHAWALAVGVVAASTVLHLVKGLDLEESAASAVVLAYLLTRRRAFTVAPDRQSILRTGATLALGAAVAVAIGTATALWIPRSTHMPVGRALAAVTERLVGIDSIDIPARRERFLTPALGGVGLALGAFALWTAFQPVVSRRRGASEPGDRSRARELVARYGGDTLAYFALRDDKQHWSHGETLVAYAVHNGVCLVSPDPIGPASDRASAWRAFHAFADDHGWSVAVMGASEGWLPTYRATGMGELYIGDEAIVDCGRFSLEGGRNKGLRQAVNRVAKNGYTIEFHDPAHLPAELEAGLRALMTESRRGEVERGFSMTLGRVFSPLDAGLLLAVCRDPSGVPAAFCQYVPAADIDGFSLDLMRRSESEEHPNGLTDFVVVRTIEHLRDKGQRGLGLNFAVMRSVLADEAVPGLGQRINRKVLGWLSESMQIESLWKYNAKFDPDWHPRYAVYDSLETFLPAALAVARAESFWELPVIGRFLQPDPASPTDAPVSP